MQMEFGKINQQTFEAIRVYYTTHTLSYSVIAHSTATNFSYIYININLATLVVWLIKYNEDTAWQH